MSISKSFVLAGSAIFTIETPDGHRTYRVDHVPANDRWRESWFVKLLVGPDNGGDYQYLGKLDPVTSEVLVTGKSKFEQDSYPVKLLNRVLARVWCDDHDAYRQHGYETHHEGCCGRCGRRLTTPLSVERGIGPECWKAMGIEQEPAPATPTADDLEDAGMPTADDVAKMFDSYEAHQAKLYANLR